MSGSNETPAERAGPSRGTVFVVDDEPEVLTTVERMLAVDGFEVRAYSSPDEFLEGYEDLDPAVIVLDVQLPGMDGLRLHQELLARRIGVPVILLTGHADASITASAFRAGVMDLIQKPVHASELCARARAAIGRDTARRRASARRDEARRRILRLTARQREIVLELVSGRTDKEIAARLGVSAQAVGARRREAMSRLGVESIAQLVRLTIVSGLDPIS